MKGKWPRSILFPVLLLSACRGQAQQTAFNVPSSDVLDRGKVYAELDATFRPHDSTFGFTPRVVVGAGHRVEVGLNLNGLAIHAANQTTLAPTVKWKVYDRVDNGWAFLVGDDLFFPLQKRSYSAGNYVYAELTRTWKSKTRATFGAYHFTPDVVARGPRAGGQFAIEQPLSSRLTLAADWYTGDHAFGYLSPGAILKLSSTITLYAAYQFGNSRASAGNNQLLVELGWNVN